jgi:hypothetical protein
MINIIGKKSYAYLKKNHTLIKVARIFQTNSVI